MSSITPAARHALQVGDGDVVLDVVDQVEAVGLAVLGRIGEAVLDRLAARWRRRRSCRAAAPHRLILRPQLRPKTLMANSVRPGAHQAGDADHLAVADVDIDVLDDLPLG